MIHNPGSIPAYSMPHECRVKKAECPKNFVTERTFPHLKASHSFLHILLLLPQMFEHLWMWMWIQTNTFGSGTGICYYVVDPTLNQTRKKQDDRAAAIFAQFFKPSTELSTGDFYFKKSRLTLRKLTENFPLKPPFAC